MANDTVNRSPNALYAADTGSSYGRGNPSPNLIERYREVYNRPEVAGDANRAALLWDSQGQSADWAGQNAYGNFLQIVGREPTLNELHQLIPIYQGGYAQGNAAVANYAQMQEQNPRNLAEKAPQYADDVNRVFQSQLGRSATPDELTHFGSAIATGNLDPYQLQDFLRGTTEYQTAQDKQFRQGLSSELENQDLSFFNKAKQNIISQFMQNGTYGSSALDSALVDLAGQLADKRASYLSNLTAQQYGGNKDLALGNYQNTQNQFLNERNYARDQARSAFDYNRSRADELGDYYRQAADYRQSQQGRNVLHPYDWLNLGLNLANTGAKAYMAAATGGAGMGGVPLY